MSTKFHNILRRHLQVVLRIFVCQTAQQQGKGPNGHILRLICSAKLVATFNQCCILGASLLGNTAQINWDFLFICIGISHSECSECRLLCDQSLGDFDGLTRDFENVIEMTPCLNTRSYGCDTWRILHHFKHWQQTTDE